MSRLYLSEIKIDTPIVFEQHVILIMSTIEKMRWKTR